jgi:hypothetical protein
VQEADLEGWYTDPFGRHEARWMSRGTPTRLVRDGEVEGDDPPASDEPFAVTPVRIEGRPPTGGRDLKRADEEQWERFDEQKEEDAASDVLHLGGVEGEERAG